MSKNCIQFHLCIRSLHYYLPPPARNNHRPELIHELFLSIKSIIDLTIPSTLKSGKTHTINGEQRGAEYGGDVGDSHGVDTAVVRHFLEMPEELPQCGIMHSILNFH